MCFKCHEVGHLANGCPNEEKLKLKKEEERLRHVKCFKCRTWGHLTSMCSTKQLVKQLKEPQLEPQDEQEKKPQTQIKINHEDGGDLIIKKKKTRRGGKARERAMHPRMNQDAKQMSKNKEEKMEKIAHMRCYSCDTLGHLAFGCPTSLRRRLKQTRRSKTMRSTT